MLMYVHGCTRLVVQPYTVEYINIHGPYHVIPNLVVRNEPNLDCFQGKYRRSDAETIGSVCLMAREKIGLQTYRHTYIHTHGRTDRDRDRDRQTDMTDRQTDSLTDRQTQTDTDRHRQTQTDTDRHRQTDRQTDWQTVRQTDTAIT